MKYKLTHDIDPYIFQWLGQWIKFYKNNSYCEFSKILLYEDENSAAHLMGHLIW